MRPLKSLDSHVFDLVDYDDLEILTRKPFTKFEELKVEKKINK